MDAGEHLSRIADSVGMRVAFRRVALGETCCPRYGKIRNVSPVF